MSYHIYTTTGLVLSERPLREADRVYSILTRDLGLVRATATGVRKSTSKLRGSLEPVTLADISLVRGKEYWRITSAQTRRRVALKVALLRPLALLEKLVQGESAHPELFDAVEEFLTHPEPEGELFEPRFVATMLYHLGYLKEEDLKLGKAALVKAINEGLRQSQLAGE